MRSGQKRHEEYEERWKRIFEMQRFDRAKLEKMPDTELAAWQGMYPVDSPQYRLVDHIWQERLADKQIRAARETTRRASLWATGSGVIGIIIGWLLSSWHPFAQERQQPSVQARDRSPSPQDQQKAMSTPPAKASPPVATPNQKLAPIP